MRMVEIMEVGLLGCLVVGLTLVSGFDLSLYCLLHGEGVHWV